MYRYPFEIGARTSPRTLLALGLALLAAVAIAYALGYHNGHRASPAAPEPTTTPLPAPAEFAIRDAGAHTSSYTARVDWTTTEPSTARLQWGPAGTVPVLWTTERTLDTRHAVTLTGLGSLASYDVTIVASTLDGRTVRTTLAFTTAGAPATADGTVRDGTLLVNGEPFFPLIAWQQCSEQLSASTAVGIDLFAGSQCMALPDLLTTLNARALVAGTDGEQSAAGPGLVGWFYPDEADARGLTGEGLPALPAGVRFLTVTSHFFSGAAPLPAGREMYPGLVGAADVVGFDLYPLQELCRPELLPAVFDAQQELEALDAGKPTFQWIEARSMRCGDDPTVRITPATIQVESWLALAAGARGLAYFPPDWQQGADVAVRGVVQRLRQLEPALLQPVVPVGVVGSPAVRASARAYGDALYVIAVNAGGAASDVRLTLPELGDRTLLVLDEGEKVAAHGGTLVDRLPPLSVRIYVAPPA